jgi:uncharacterized membrane protein
LWFKYAFYAFKIHFMNGAYIHIVVNHFPIIGSIIGTLLLMAGMVFRNEGVKISGLGTIVFASIMAIIANVTGDSAKESVEGLNDVARSLINRHEDIASVALFLIIPSGLLASLSLYSMYKKERSVRFLLIITLVLSLISCVAMAYAGRTGGQIRHTGLRNDAAKKYILEHQNENEKED